MTGSRTRGFLFADLRDYTDYLSAHGDHAGAELIATFRGLVRAAIADTDGAEVRTEGDSFYVTFDSASSAVRCGLAILEASAEAEPPIRVGIGVHAGEAVETDHGLIGSAVNIAARVCAQARAGELLVTDTVRGLTLTFLDVTFISLGPRRLKGVVEPVSLYRVTPRGNVTRVPVNPLLARPRNLAVSILAGVLAIGVVVAALGGGVALLARPAVPSPTAAPSAADALSASAAPSPDRTPTTGPSPTVESFPNDIETALLQRLPAPVRDNATCRRGDPADRTEGATATLRCDLTPGLGATVAWFETMSPAAIAGRAAAVRNERITPEGDCATQPRAWQEWTLAGFYSGHLLCYGDAGASWLLWTYDADGVIARATRPDSNWHALYNWWKTVGPFLRQ